MNEGGGQEQLINICLILYSDTGVNVFFYFHDMTDDQFVMNELVIDQLTIYNRRGKYITLTGGTG